MRKIFALSLTVNPERQAAREIEKLLRFPGFLKRDSFAKDRVEIVELRVGEESILNGISLSELTSIVKCQVLVCTVLRDGEAIMPGGSFILEENDRIFVTAPTNASQKSEHNHSQNKERNARGRRKTQHISLSASY